MGLLMTTEQITARFESARDNVYFDIHADIYKEPQHGVVGYLYSDLTEYNDSMNERVGIVMKRGDYNGYVIVTENHPLYGKSDTEIDELLDNLGYRVHGGVTYSSREGYNHLLSESLSRVAEKTWTIGFDTAHCFDTREKWTLERFKQELDKFVEAVTTLGRIHSKHQELGE